MLLYCISNSSWGNGTLIVITITTAATVAASADVAAATAAT